MLRILLESQAAGLAAERATPAQVARLRALTDQMHALITEKPHNYLMDLQVANNGFHEVLLEASASPRLVQITENLLDAPLLNGGFYVYSHEDMLRSVHHHRDIILAIENRDAELAKHAMKTHLRASYHTLIQGHSSKDAE
ncbi:MAG: hypothetical protein CTR53_11770 [Ferrovibrio sp.]|nr:MAG: hypothetical protein CTR53_11770 [Ferrovibrio sp.]